MKNICRDTTNKRMENPQIGDVFYEMCSFWVKVTDRNGDKVTVTENGAQRCFDTIEDFKKAYAYQSIEGYWIRFLEKQKA